MLGASTIHEACGARGECQTNDRNMLVHMYCVTEISSEYVCRACVYRDTTHRSLQTMLLNAVASVTCPRLKDVAAHMSTCVVPSGPQRIVSAYAREMSQIP